MTKLISDSVSELLRFIHFDSSCTRNNLCCTNNLLIVVIFFAFTKVCNGVRRHDGELMSVSRNKGKLMSDLQIIVLALLISNATMCISVFAVSRAEKTGLQFVRGKARRGGKQVLVRGQ